VIQRSQTIFLALSIISSFLVYFTPVYDKAMQDPQMWIGYGLASGLALAMILSIFSIFKYSDRKSQIKWVKIAMLFQLAGIGFAVGVLFSLGGIGTYLWDEAIGAGLAVLGLLFQGLANRSIKKDLELVRSIDRIR
jgi:peptidoglycan/LPS O-acetylase OafA/YrhL